MTQIFEGHLKNSQTLYVRDWKYISQSFQLIDCTSLFDVIYLEIFVLKQILVNIAYFDR